MKIIIEVLYDILKVMDALARHIYGTLDGPNIFVVHEKQKYWRDIIDTISLAKSKLYRVRVKEEE